VPARQSFFDPGVAAPAYRQPHPALQPPSHGPSGAAASFRWRPHSLTHHPGPFYTMGRGHPSPLHFGGKLCRRPNRRLGRTLRRPGADYLRPRLAVLFFSLGCAYAPLGRKNAHSTTPYHPQSNKAVERFHRRLKDSLRARLAGGDWPDHLPWVLLGLRVAPREDSGVSVAELVFGSPLSLPGQFFSAAEPPPSSFVQQLRSAVPCVADKSGCSPPPAPPPASLCSARFVYVRSPPVSPGLAPAFRGPYRVRVPGVKFFVIDIGGKPSAVSVDNIKPHLGSSPLSAAPPPRRGRPPRQV
jgi:hypothetical protein